MTSRVRAKQDNAVRLKVRDDSITELLNLFTANHTSILPRTAPRCRHRHLELKRLVDHLHGPIPVAILYHERDVVLGAALCNRNHIDPRCP